MARGKQAAKAANRRLEATQDHVDRLTDQLAEAKLRARQCEKAAGQVPGLLDEIARLRADVQSGSSAEVRRLADAVRAEKRKRVEHVDTLMSVIGEITTDLEAVGLRVSHDARDRVASVTGNISTGTASSRATRRAVERLHRSPRHAPISTSPDSRRKADRQFRENEGAVRALAEGRATADDLTAITRTIHLVLSDPVPGKAGVNELVEWINDAALGYPTMEGVD